MKASSSPPLSEPQLAALAKAACGAEAGGGLVLLVGPAGVGKSTVLQTLAEQQPVSDRPRSLEEWLAEAPARLPAMLLVDDAHLETETDLARLLAHARLRQPEAAVVLAGQGRLFTLVARDTRLEQAIRIRAVLLPGSRSDTHRLVEAALPAAARLADDALPAMHELAGGVPAAVSRLADLAAVVAGSCPDGLLTAADIEAIHRRLSPLAA
jgi:type II secretory pathway predicted ATPase ExeA